jgi:hypothetical protein
MTSESARNKKNEIVSSRKRAELRAFDPFVREFLERYPKGGVT